MDVTWEDDAASGLVRSPSPGDRIFVSLRWPREHRIGRPADPFDWSQGSIKIDLLPLDLRSGEEWRQVIVDRDQSVTTINEAGARFASVSPYQMLLMGDLEATISPSLLNMSLNSFLAWGSGVQRLTVYDTRVTRRTRAKNSYPESLAGARRIIGAYDVDMPALARAVALIRATTERWERSLSTSWRNCRRATEGDIVLTDHHKP
jgi:hypothetical protein